LLKITRGWGVQMQINGVPLHLGSVFFLCHDNFFPMFLL
jgi:hypothetical protein